MQQLSMCVFLVLKQKRNSLWTKSLPILCKTLTDTSAFVQTARKSHLFLKSDLKEIKSGLEAIRDQISVSRHDRPICTSWCYYILRSSALTHGCRSGFQWQCFSNASDTKYTLKPDLGCHMTLRGLPQTVAWIWCGDFFFSVQVFLGKLGNSLDVPV